MKVKTRVYIKGLELINEELRNKVLCMEAEKGSNWSYIKGLEKELEQDSRIMRKLQMKIDILEMKLQEHT